jgi:tetratricopeptide (TPR) repeat protein
MPLRKRLLIFPLATQDESPSADARVVCRAMPVVFERTLGSLPGLDCVLQHLMIGNSRDTAGPTTILLSSMWTLEEALSLPLPDDADGTHLLQGALRWNSSKRRLTLQLIDIEQRAIAFDETIEGTPNAFIQSFYDLIARLSHVVSPPPTGLTRSISAPTRDPEAFDWYLLGHGHALACRMRPTAEAVTSATESFVRALELDSTLGDAADQLNSLATWALLERGLAQEEAEAALERGLAAAPDAAVLRSGLGMWRAMKGDIDGGQRLLEQYVTAVPTGSASSRSQSMLAMLYRRQGRSRDAAAMLEKAVAADRENATAWQELAAAHLEAGREHEGERCLRRALEIEPERAQALAQLGMLLWRRGDHERGRIVMRRAVDAPDADGDIFASFVNAALADGQVEAADEIATRWAEEHPGQPAAWLALAAVRQAAGDMEGARFAIDRVFDSEPTNTHRIAAQLFRLRLDDPEAHEELQRLIATGPESGNPPISAAARARRLEILAETHPDTAAIWAALFEALAEDERWADAAAAHRRSLQLLEPTAESYSTLAALHLRAEDHAEALAIVRKALSLSPDFAPAWELQGMALAALRKPEEAIASWERALSIDPTRRAARSALGLMRKALEARRAQARASTAPQPAWYMPHALQARAAAAAGTLARWWRSLRK